MVCEFQKKYYEWFRKELRSSNSSPGSHAYYRERAEYGFGEYGFKHRTQWVFHGSLSSGERAQWVPFSLLFVCKRELTEFLTELTEFAPKLSEAQWVLFSETALSKQYSAHFWLMEVESCPGNLFSLLNRKKPHAHKNKIGTSTPLLKKTRTPPPPKRRNFMGMGVSSRKNQKMPGAHKIGAAVSGPDLRAEILRTSRFFWLKQYSRNSIPPVPFPEGPAIEKIQSRLIAWNIQSMRLKFSISLEMFDPDLDNSPHREPYFQSRLKCSISIENFNLRLVAWKFQSRSEILNFFNLWALLVDYPRKIPRSPAEPSRTLEERTPPREASMTSLRGVFLLGEPRGWLCPSGTKRLKDSRRIILGNSMCFMSTIENF